jgi:octaprenyl-diphosphate synthase
MPLSGNVAEIEMPNLAARRAFNLIAAELALVETEFARQANSNVQVIAYIGDYLRASGGKRVRPALTLLSTYAVGGDGASANAVRMATVMEFLHTATLVHDDIIDNAETRRNRPSVNSRFGNQTAVLMGDWLYMSAFETSLKERSLAILDILTAVTRQMTEGELIQLTMLGRTDISEEEYFDVLRRKTAYLFSACCEIGAILGGADEKGRKALRDYGMRLGEAFQLVDDLLDFISTEDALGKPAGVDLLEGKVTLPLIYALQKDFSLAQKIKRVIYDGNYDNVSREMLREAAARTQAIARTRARAEDAAEAARQALNALAPSRYRDALDALPLFVLEREK